MAALQALNEAVIDCRRCPRLVEWREQVAREKRAAFRDWDYWGRPMQGFGDPAARVLILGLAPAAHGGNRTGRIFTGDRSGDFLFASLHRVGMANQAESVSRDDGLRLDGAYVVAAVRCAPPANLPLPSERANCAEWLEREVALLPDVHVVVCLGGFAWESALRLRAALGGAPVPRPKPKFGHAVLAEGDPWPLLGCFHPSQQNTFTGKLTPDMMDAVFTRARELAWGGEPVRRDPARAVGGRAGRLGAAGAAADRHQRARDRPVPARADGVVRDRRRGVGVARRRVRDRRPRGRPARRPRGRAPGAAAAGALHAVALGAIVGLTELDAPVAVLLVCGFAAGFAVPPTSSVLRSQWTNLLEPRLHQAAYALDSTMIEVIFISGPLLTAAIAYVASPAAALIVSAVAVLAGTTIFTALPPTREIAFERGEAKGLLGALASPGVRTLVYTSLPAGVGIGILEVGIPAFSREEGAAAAAGVLLAIWSVGSGDRRAARTGCCRAARGCTARICSSVRCCRSRCCRWPWRRPCR